MRQNFFIVNDQSYFTGTIFLINDMGKQVEASFICYDTERKQYIYKINECTWWAPERHFQKNFIAVTDKRDNRVHMPVVKTRKDSEISGLFLGWVWYIFLMGLSLLFKDCIGLWIVISVVFFRWRKEKIDKEGTYIEW